MTTRGYIYLSVALVAVVSAFVLFSPKPIDVTSCLISLLQFFLLFLIMVAPVLFMPHDLDDVSRSRRRFFCQDCGRVWIT